MHSAISAPNPLTPVTPGPDSQNGSLEHTKPDPSLYTPSIATRSDMRGRLGLAARRSFLQINVPHSEHCSLLLHLHLLTALSIKLQVDAVDSIVPLASTNRLLKLSNHKLLISFLVDARTSRAGWGIAITLSCFWSKDATVQGFDYLYILRRRSAYTTKHSDVFGRTSIRSDNDSDFISMLQSDAWRTVQEVCPLIKDAPLSLNVSP